MSDPALREMSATRARASTCIVIAAVAAVCAACDGGARRADSGVPDVKIGTFSGSARGIANVLSTDPLVAVDFDGRPVNRLAESVALSQDGRHLTVRLRSGVKLHTGETLTARHVSELLPLKPTFMTEVRQIEVKDDLTLVITAKRPHAIKAADLSEAPIDDDRLPQLRTGPFKIVSLNPSGGSTPPAVLESFKDYFLGVALPARVEISEYQNHRTAWTALMRGDVNFLHEVNRDSIEFIEAGGNVQAYPLLRPYVVPLVFNLKHPVLQKRDVRVAINEAIDRDEIVVRGMRGHGEVAEGPFWPHHWAYSRGRHTFPFNPEVARLRLDAAGLGIRHEPAQMPARFRFTCLLRQGDTRFERIALVVQRQLFAIGVDMQLVLVPHKEFMHRIVQTSDYDAFIFEMSTGRTLNFPQYFWHSRSGSSMSGYSAADEALDRMKTGSSENDIRSAVSDVMRIMRADPPAAFLVTPREVRAADKAFVMPHEPGRDVFGTFWKVRPKETASNR